MTSIKKFPLKLKNSFREKLMNVRPNLGNSPPVGWRRVGTVPLDPNQCYFAFIFGEGRGVIKKIDSQWVFVKREDHHNIIFPITCIENIFCLYPILTHQRRKKDEI